MTTYEDDLDEVKKELNDSLNDNIHAIHVAFQNSLNQVELFDKFQIYVRLINLFYKQSISKSPNLSMKNEKIPVWTFLVHNN